MHWLVPFPLGHIDTYSLNCRTHPSYCFPFQISTGVSSCHQHSRQIKKSFGSLTHCLCRLGIDIFMYINVIDTLRCMLYMLQVGSNASM